MAELGDDANPADGTVAARIRNAGDRVARAVNDHGRSVRDRLLTGGDLARIPAQRLANCRHRKSRFVSKGIATAARVAKSTATTCATASNVVADCTSGKSARRAVFGDRGAGRNVLSRVPGGKAVVAAKDACRQMKAVMRENASDIGRAGRYCIVRNVDARFGTDAGVVIGHLITTGGLVFETQRSMSQLPTLIDFIPGGPRMWKA